MAPPRRDRPSTKTLSYLDTGALIREARQLAALTQAELAKRLGTSQSVVSRWERSLDIPRVDTLGRILQACGFEADLRFRRHDDVDRSLIRYQLSLSPLERARLHDGVTELMEIGREAMVARR